ncbi:MAG: type I restriction-modification system subunit M [Opitutales bacterium]|nr:type I restriction-modification system subunit M [Opitutales bacterium]MCH8539358.1 type I restriction-modification system subunit M [Opitutales bacterium]
MAITNGNYSSLQKEINNIVWRACDTFRGTIDPSQYKDYILVMLFVKYLSDLHRDRYDALKNQFGDDEAMIRRRLQRERFVIPAGCSFYDLHAKRNKDDIGEQINKALEALEDANKKKLAGVFRNIDFNNQHSLGETRDRNRRLKNLLEDFNDPRLDLRPSRIGSVDIIGNCYLYLISHFASDAGKKGGEFYTPDEVALLLAKLVQPTSGDRICDPTCGSGGLLINAAEQVPDGNFAVYGQEINGGTLALAKMNMFLHGIDNATIEWGDTLNNPKLLENDTLQQFNVVVANPPFSLDKWGAEDAQNDRFARYHRGIPPKSKADWAFITHMVETAVDDGGRVGVVVPHGVLFRGSSEGKIRESMIQENLLEAVIGLPEKLFFGTGIPAAILLFRKGRERKEVLFIDASREFDSGTKQNRLSEANIAKIVGTYERFATLEKYSYAATAAEIAENDYNLNIPRYVDTFEPEPEVDLAQVSQEIQETEAKLVEVQAQIKDYLKELHLDGKEGKQ